MPDRPGPRNPDATARRERLDRPHVAIPTFRVSVVDGPDRGKSVLVGPQSATRVFVGTSAACELALTDREVSRRHLALELEGASLRVTDLGSTNGTTIEGVSIASARLRGGERIVVGATSLRADLVEQGTAVRFPPVESFGQVLGKSVAMRRLYPVFQKLAASDVPVLVEGETGTGKELLAEAIHDMGPRKGKPFVVFDWQAVDPKRVESVLFGEQDRSKRRPGVFEEAAGGTVLIDEIAEMPLVLQAKLLRVLERSEVMPVGASAWIPVQARVIAVTARDLERAVEHESFREDLFYRLVVGRVSLPPLRHREGDVPLLAEHFWRRATGGSSPMPADLLAAHEGYAWPGNVRELAHVVERRALLGAVPDFQEPAAPSASPDQAFRRVLEMDLPLTQARQRIVEEFERAYLERVVAKHGGNITRAAAASGIARRYFHQLRARYKG